MGQPTSLHYALSIPKSVLRVLRREHCLLTLVPDRLIQACFTLWTMGPGPGAGLFSETIKGPGIKAGKALSWL